MQRILSGLGMAGASSTSSNERSAVAPLAAAASAGSALAAMASRRLGQRDEVRPDRSTIPPSTTAPILAASAWRKLTNRMGWTLADQRGRTTHQPHPEERTQCASRRVGNLPYCCPPFETHRCAMLLRV